MNIHLPNNAVLQDIINDFNVTYSVDSSLVYSNEIVLPQSNNGEIIFNKHTSTILLLCSLLPENPHLETITYIYLAIIVKLADGQYNDIDYLLHYLNDQFLAIQDQSIKSSDDIFINFQYYALLTHEITHIKLDIDLEYKQKRNAYIKNFINSINKPKGIRGFFYRYFVSYLDRQQNIEEFICDAEAAKYIAEQYKKGCISSTKLSCIIAQLRRMFFVVQLISNITRTSQYSIKERLQNIAFEMHRSPIFCLALIDELGDNFPEDISSNIIQEASLCSDIILHTIRNTQKMLDIVIAQQYDESFTHTLEYANSIRSKFDSISDLLLNHFVKY